MVPVMDLAVRSLSDAFLKWSARPVPGGVRGLVRREREARNWTQKELAREAGLSRSAVQKIETGERKPNLATAKKLARAFGISIDEFTE